MEFGFVLLVAALVFGVCALLDKAFTKTFRNSRQHKSGNAVRLSKRYGSMGLIVAVLGIASVLAGIPDNLLLLIGGAFLILVGVAFVVYYLSFGVFYDDDGFLLAVFGRKSKTYQFKDICTQKLYNSYGNIVVELHLSDERSVQLHGNMEGTTAFLNYAFSKWLEQTGTDKGDCDFHNPNNSCWFPMED